MAATPAPARPVAVVTGANKGIGFHVADQLAEAGHAVWVGSRDADRGRAAVDRLAGPGRDVRLLVLDVTDAASVTAAAAVVRDGSGRLDVLVNNAGVLGEAAPPTATTADEMRRIHETNVVAVLTTTNAFLPLLHAAPSARVVNVSSDLGSLTGMADPQWEYAGVIAAAYQSSKAAQNALTLNYARELRGTGITVNAANPGFRATDINGHMPGAGDPAEGAAVISRLALAGPGGPTGEFHSDDGGLYPW